MQSNSSWIPQYPLQAGSCMETNPSLDTMLLKGTASNAFVKAFASWSQLDIWRSLMNFTWSFSWTTQQSNSICFVRLWKDEFLAIWRAEYWLSQWRPEVKRKLENHEVSSATIEFRRPWRQVHGVLLLKMIVILLIASWISKKLRSLQGRYSIWCQICVCKRQVAQSESLKALI